jgi:hypothetical protein
VSRYPGQVDHAALQVDKEQGIEATECDRVDVEKNRTKACQPPGLARTRTTKGQWTGAPVLDGDDLGLYGPSSPTQSPRACGIRPRCGGSPTEGSLGPSAG